MDGYDALAVLGIGLIGVGCWLIAPALALIAVGSLLMVGGVVGARAKAGGGR